MDLTAVLQGRQGRPGRPDLTGGWPSERPGVWAPRPPASPADASSRCSSSHEQPRTYAHCFHRVPDWEEGDFENAFLIFTSCDPFSKFKRFSTFVSVYHVCFLFIS